MKSYRILVPTDFSECSDGAVELATSLARDRKPSQIYLVHVQDSVVPPYDEDLGVFEPERLIATIKMTHTQRARDIPMESVFVHGQPAEEILKLANDKDVDLVVMGTHGRTGLAHLLMGSVAESVLRRAPCPVMTIRQGKKEHASSA